MTDKIKLEIEIDLDMQWDWHMKKHNNSPYTKEQLTPAILKLIKSRAEDWWYGNHFFDQDRHMKEFMDIVINNTSFDLGDTIIIKTDEEQPIDDNSVVRLY